MPMIYWAVHYAYDILSSALCLWFIEQCIMPMIYWAVHYAYDILSSALCLWYIEQCIMPMIYWAVHYAYDLLSSALCLWFIEQCIMPMIYWAVHSAYDLLSSAFCLSPRWEDAKFAQQTLGHLLACPICIPVKQILTSKCTCDLCLSSQVLLYKGCILLCVCRHGFYCIKVVFYCVSVVTGSAV